MNNNDHRIRHEDGDRSAHHGIGGGYPGGAQSHKLETPGKRDFTA